MRRTLDAIVSIVALICFAVLLPFIAVAMRIDSKGSIFYSQIRVGKNRKHFTIYKLRSMIVEAEKNGPQLTVAGDSRVTRVGRFLRVTKLDEIPQFYNVIRGDMAIIGPRPERPEFVSQYEFIPSYNARFKVLPGITGLAQIRNGYDSDLNSVRRKARFDEFYMKHKSMGLDIGILLGTIRVCLKGR